MPPMLLAFASLAGLLNRSTDPCGRINPGVQAHSRVVARPGKQREGDARLKPAARVTNLYRGPMVNPDRSPFSGGPLRPPGCTRGADRRAPGGAPRGCDKPRRVERRRPCNRLEWRMNREP